MRKISHKKAQAAAKKAAGQAAIELAVFGAIVIFLLGTIVRSAMGNSYQQNQNLKAMRMAMLASWEGTTGGPGNPNACEGCSQNTSHNSASVMVIEDRLTPDVTKYGDMDRTPFVASGSGTFSYNLLYPLSDSSDIINSLPMTDIYINGQHFPFTMSGYVQNQGLARPSSCPNTNGPNGFWEPNAKTHLTQAQCLSNRCLRNQMEWGGRNGLVYGSDFLSASMAPVTATNAADRQTQEENNACWIFAALLESGMLQSASGTSCNVSNVGDSGSIYATISPAVVLPTSALSTSSTQWSGFAGQFNTQFPPPTNTNKTNPNTGYLNAILNILKSDASVSYKYFYSITPNSGTESPSSWDPGDTTAPPLPFSPFDYMRFHELISNPNDAGYGFLSEASGMRMYMGWQWSQTAATSASNIGLNTSNNEYPTIDVDGRLQEVTVFTFSQNADGSPTVSYLDPELGDINGQWDVNASCGPKPGLQSPAQVYTFTSYSCANGVACPASGVCPEGGTCGGTYLLIQEGGLYNSQTGPNGTTLQYVRSVNKRDTIDLISRTVQLSHNTGRFCTDPAVTNQSSQLCSTYCQSNTGASLMPGQLYCQDCANYPNASPVEACVSESSSSDNCFTSANIAQTCYDTNPSVNSIFVRSRLEDRRGRSWMTDTTGKLQVH